MQLLSTACRGRRDHLEQGVHDKNQRKNKVKLVSITQLTDDDSHGELIRTINAVFDGYLSQHTSEGQEPNPAVAFFDVVPKNFGWMEPAKGKNVKR
jgi:hypothetical protein